MTRRRTGQEGPNRGAGPVNPLRPAGATVRARAANDPHQVEDSQPGAQHNPPRTAPQLARHRRRKHPHQVRPGSTFSRFPSGGYPKTPGTPGTNRKSTRNPLSPLGFSVPGGHREQGQRHREHREQLDAGKCAAVRRLCGRSLGWSCFRPWGWSPGRRRCGALGGRSGVAQAVHIPPKVGEYPGGSVHYAAPQLPTHRTGRE